MSAELELLPPRDVGELGCKAAFNACTASLACPTRPMKQAESRRKALRVHGSEAHRLLAALAARHAMKEHVQLLLGPNRDIAICDIAGCSDAAARPKESVVV